MIFRMRPLLVLAVMAVSPAMVLAQDSSAPKPDYGSKDAEADAAKLANVDKVPGYGGIAFGAAFPSDGFELEQDRGNLKIFKKDKENLLLGPALLETILYYVVDGKLYGVAFHTDDGQDSLALKGIFIQAFGMGTNSQDGAPSTVWIGKKNGALFDLNTATGEGSAFLFDNKLHDAVLAEQSAAAKSAAQKLIQGK